MVAGNGRSVGRSSAARQAAIWPRCWKKPRNYFPTRPYSQRMTASVFPVSNWKKKGILELELVRDGMEICAPLPRKYPVKSWNPVKGGNIWTDKTIAFFRWEKGVEIQIEIPQIEIPSDIILEGNLNRIFENGVRERLNQCGWNMDEMDRWEKYQHPDQRQKTFESAEYISIRYTGSVVTDEGSHDLDFGTTCHTSDGGGMVELTQIFNDKIFDQYENSRTMYPVYAENEDAFADFPDKRPALCGFLFKTVPADLSGNGKGRNCSAEMCREMSTRMTQFLCFERKRYGTGTSSGTRMKMPE